MKIFVITIKPILISCVFYFIVLSAMIIFGQKITANEKAHMEQIMKRNTIGVTATVTE